MRMVRLMVRSVWFLIAMTAFCLLLLKAGFSDAAGNAPFRTERAAAATAP